MSIAIISSPRCLLHNMGEEHPEKPARLHYINDRLYASGMEMFVQFNDALPITKERLQLVHDKQFIDDVFALSPSENDRVERLADDTFLMQHTLHAALDAAGSVTQAVDMVLGKQVDRVFCSVRPPGHHASQNKSSGFCIFNNVALGAKYALENMGLKKVAIVDFDVHHGDGTQKIFEHDERVMLCSSFQHPLFPFSGSEKTRHDIINTELKAGINSEDYRVAVSHWFEALRCFKPELIFISAGFDAHIEDELSQIDLVESDFAWITARLKEIAVEVCDGRIISVLEGGYALDALGRSVVAHIKSLAE